MKRSMLALACAAAFAAAAEEWGYVGFEAFDVGAMTYGSADSAGWCQNSNDGNFLYEASSGSADGSSVVAYDGAPSLPAGSPKAVGENYLSLSTEGGTLWRSLNTPQLDGTDTDVANGTWEFGTAVDASDTSIYIDTMVQFTPTEDGSEPDVGTDAKLAIWLNVATGDDGNATTNLCVRAAQISSDGVPTAMTFTIVNKPDIVPGKWYRLTVEAIATIDPDEDYGFGDPIPGFIVRLDGDVLVADKCTVDDDVKDEIGDRDVSDVFKDVIDNKVFASINGSDAPTLSAVGFKGSGAIDEFLATDVAPTFEATVTTVDFTLAWGEGVSAVSYTIGGETKAAENGVAIAVENGATVTVSATPADWYTIASGTGDVTVDAAKTVTVTAALAESPSALGITADGISTADLKAWADGKATIEALKGSGFVTESFLLNTASLLTAAPTLKIEDVEVMDDGKMKIVVSATGDGNAVDMEKINGQLKITSGDTLDALATATKSIAGADLVENDGKATVTVEAGKFAKVSVEVK